MGADLRSRKATGRPARITKEQWRSVYRPSLTYGAIANLIAVKFGVKYDENHVGRMLKRYVIEKPAVAK